MRARNYYSHLRAPLATLDFQPAAELFDPFSHSYDSDAGAFAWGVTVQHAVRYTSPVISYRNSQSFVNLVDLDLGLVASGMQVNICKAGLHNPEEREFCFFGQSLQTVRYIYFYVEALSSVDAPRIHLDGRPQTAFIQQRRMQKVGKGPDLV